MKIADVSLKKILRWVPKTNDSGFNIPNLQKSLKLDDHQKAGDIFGWLKLNGYIRHTGRNSELYAKTGKVASELNIVKRWYEKPVGIIIIIIISGAFLAFLLQYFGLNGN